jgi:tRNA (guanine-N7-)-methyltransferase
MLAARDDYHWLARRPGDWRSPPAGWIGTRYEAKAIGRGEAPIYLRFARRDQGENARSL